MERKNTEPGLDIQEFLNPRGKLSSFATFFHILWLKKWRLFALWVLLGLPAAVFLAFYDIPRDYSATTYLRFPRVIGTEESMARDVSLGEQESVVRLFLSQKVLLKTIRDMSLQLKIVTRNVFRHHLIQAVAYAPDTYPGRYQVEFRGDRRVEVRHRPWEKRGYRVVYAGHLDSAGAVSFGGMRIQFRPSFLTVSRGFTLDLVFMTPDEALLDFAGRLEVEPLDKGQVTVNYGVTLKDRDPQLAAEVLNELTRNFIAIYSGTTETQDMGVLARMEKNLETAREGATKSQERLGEFYRKNQSHLAVREGNPYALASAQTQKAQLETNLDRLAQSLTGKPAVGDSEDQKRLWIGEMLALLSGQGVQRAEALRGKITELEQKRAKMAANYSPTHPYLAEVDREISALYDPVLRLAESTRQSYQGRLGQAGGEILRNLPGGGTNMALELEARRLTDDRDNATRNLDNVQAEYDRAKLSAGPNLFKVNIIDPARPPLYQPPSLRTRLGYSAAAFLLAFFPGLVAAMLAQILLPRIWNKDDAERKLKVKVLGSLFHMEPAKGGKPPPTAAGGLPVDRLLIYHGGGAGLIDVEAYRSLRVEVENFFEAEPAGRFAPPGFTREGMPLLITSTHPNEGKSLVAANLAVSFARRGTRTLLVDTDFRHGRVERIFGYRPQRGLADLLRERSPADIDFMSHAQGFLLPTMQTGLSIMPKGTFDEATLEGIFRTPMEIFLKAAKASFEVVILDAAPVIVTADPLNLARMVDGVLFVLRSGHVSAREAERALEPLRDRGLPLAAAVNAIRRSPTDENYFAKYGYYYVSAPGTAARDSDQAVPPVRTLASPRRSHPGSGT